MLKKYKKIIISASIILVATIGLYVVNKGIGGNKDEDKVNMDIMSIPSRDKIFINGIIAAQETESIVLDATKGKVDSVSVTNGQVVEKGAVLFTYKNEAVTEQINSFEREVANSNNQRKKLADRKYESNQDLQTQKTELEKAKQQALANASAEKAANVTEVETPLAQINDSSLAAIESQIQAYDDQISTLDYQISSLQEQIAAAKEKEYTQVTAPIAGKVTLSEDSNPINTPYITIDSTTLIVNGSVSEKDHFKISIDQAAEIVVLSNNKEVTGKVLSVGDKPLATASLNGTQSAVSQYEVKLSLDSQENLVNGYHVQGTVLAKEYIISIPKSAIVNVEGKNYVFKVVDKKLTKQEVTYKDGENDKVIIESGLAEEDEILVNPTDTTEEGTLVE